MIAKINTNKKYLEYFKNMLLRFFFMFKEITGLCSLRNGVFAQEIHGILFITKWSFALRNEVITSFLLTVIPIRTV